MMKKFFIMAVIGVLYVSTAYGQSTAADLDAAIRQAGQETSLKFAMGPRVALLNFSSPASDLSVYVLRELALFLEGRRSSTVIPRQDIDRVLAAANLRASGEVTDTAARQAGRTLNAQFVVTGSLEKTGDNYRLRTRLISVGDGSVAATSAITFRENAHLRQLLGTAAPVTYKIGDIGPAGGFIFYDKGNNSGGWQYLEAAPANTERELPMGPLPGSQNEKRTGTGKEITRKIVENYEQAGGGNNTAPWYCSQLAINGFNDWYLPSSDELFLMYNNLYMQGVGDFRASTYWNNYSSGNYYPNFMDFSRECNASGTNSNTERHRVRAIRQF